MKKNTAVDFWVGLFVLIGALALVFLALKAGNLSSFTTGDQYRVTAEFDNIGGLKPRAPVKSAGVTVGRVANINLDPVTFRAVVALDLEEGFEFPKDSSARILTSGLLGEQYVGIEAGGDLENLASGEKFARTQSAVVLENLISQFLFSKASEGDSEK
ncbi:MAG: outer membrane lipid asymmetry maintenance protein MlaD [Gammaproteobacteria bacterium]|jgi:phospholipid/cholesterol/gamma-HCH transport system substrate-binding protein|uniref:outer membrane lipid asymmetry maintenance protein MlaD n=2 Tax=Limnobacter TaxID=131079 RepID=UPI000156C919|nr:MULTISPECIES: outer membrane lipid asymmetry maintenance protein MlaD [unclassified Limnobacter]EDM85117.1 Mammalian cell entry related protein [Limnobacter sp. MED105]MAZ10599.1 outer membrane lipid asymmetry maintenance protein MlaD [Sutterellaceae bacterium]MBU0543651.1 outer membrane lipid asymmetry maintenance protein MlaD [Gammaproteobacteria bacterium]|tara:strand:- start:1299 stop:1772 length:474 start_codon:yes stop_codon:yes gene_type:complete